LTTTELAEVIGIYQTTATRTLALIRRKKLLSDTAGADRRERRWSLTPLGEKTLSALHPRWQAAQEALEKQLGHAQAVALKKALFLVAKNASLT
jgi:DNA-binding MarR family transcriptional regulator